MLYSNRNNFIRNFYKNCGLKTGSTPFCVCKELSTTSIGKCILLLKHSTYIRHESKITSNQRPPQIPFYRGFLVNYKGPGTRFQATIFIDFFDKKFYFVMFINWPNFVTRLWLLPKLFNKMCFVLYA